MLTASLSVRCSCDRVGGGASDDTEAYGDSSRGVGDTLVGDSSRGGGDRGACGDGVLAGGDGGASSRGDVRGGGDVQGGSCSGGDGSRDTRAAGSGGA